MLRRIGLGPIPGQLAGHRVVVRQFGAIVTGVFLITMVTLMGAAILANPTATVEGGDDFDDRLYFGMLVVPAWWAVRRFFLRPRIEISSDVLLMHNAFSSSRLRWPEVTDAALTSGIEVRVSDGDPHRSMVFGPALSTPFTRDSRAAAVVALIRSTASTLGGGSRNPDDAYQADDLVAASVGKAPAAGIAAAITHRRSSLGWAELGAYALLWAVLSLVTAALS